MRELLLRCSGSQADSLTDALMQAGALAASVEDADSDTPEEQPLFGEPGSEASPEGWRSNLVIALLPDGVDPAQLLAQCQQVLSFEIDSPGQLRNVPDQDWVRLTQSQFEPIAVGSRLLIVPTWHRDSIDAHERVRLELDPGLAFGTGSHPTTHLCLAWLDAEMQSQASVLDYGCGSGILAIAARLLGAGRVVGVDIDEQAVMATMDNAKANGVDVVALLPDGLVPETFDVVIANILSSPLKVLAPMLCHRVRPGGSIVLSGVLARQAEEVAEHYRLWADLSVYGELDGWVCLAGKRRAAEG